MNQTKTIKSKFSEKKAASILDDYRLACASREASILGRKEVFMGKAKFGIFGDGKEVTQIAMAKVFREGDFRAGYYRDQTFMFPRWVASRRRPCGGVLRPVKCLSTK